MSLVPSAFGDEFLLQGTECGCSKNSSLYTATFTLIPISSDGLEILSLSVSNGISKACISVFYRPPNSLSVIFEYFLLYLQSLDIS